MRKAKESDDLSPGEGVRECGQMERKQALPHF